MKQRQEFMKKARIEAQIQAKIEKDRIMTNISTATKKLAMKEFMDTKNKKDMKMYKAERKRAQQLLKDILNPN